MLCIQTNITNTTQLHSILQSTNALPMSHKNDVSEHRNVGEDVDERLLEKYACFSHVELHVLRVMFQNYSQFQETSSMSYLQKLVGDEMVPISTRICEMERLLPHGFSSALQEVVHSAFVFSSESEFEDLEVFLEGLAICMGRRGIDAQRRAFYDVCVKCSKLNEATAKVIVYLSYQLVVCSNVLLSNITGVQNESKHWDAGCNSSEALNSMIRSLMKDTLSALKVNGIYSSVSGPLDIEPTLVHTPTVQKSVFLSWSERVAFMIASSLSYFLDVVLHLGAISISKTDSHFILEDQNNLPTQLFGLMSSTNSSIFDSQFLFALSCMTTNFCKTDQMVRIYTPSDGFSFHRLQYSIVGYGGPTLIIIRAKKGGIFGAYTTTIWKDCGLFYGNSDCFLFQLEPTLHIYHSKEESECVSESGKYMYLNTSRTRGGKLLRGIAFGGTYDKARLYINESFEQCEAGSFDYTFEEGPLLPSEFDRYFDIEEIEVWGFGGNHAIDSQRKQRRQNDFALNKAKTVDKSMLLMDFSASLVDSKIYAHKKHIED